MLEKKIVSPCAPGHGSTVNAHPSRLAAVGLGAALRYLRRALRLSHRRLPLREAAAHKVVPHDVSFPRSAVPEHPAEPEPRPR